MLGPHELLEDTLSQKAVPVSTLSPDSPRALMMFRAMSLFGGTVLGTAGC